MPRRDPFDYDIRTCRLVSLFYNASEDIFYFVFRYVFVIVAATPIVPGSLIAKAVLMKVGVWNAIRVGNDLDDVTIEVADMRRILIR